MEDPILTCIVESVGDFILVLLLLCKIANAVIAWINFHVWIILRS
jgi:hypothetical protein